MFSETCMTVEQVADILQVSTKTVRREMARGRINYHRVSNQVRFTSFDVSNYLIQNRK